MQFQVYLVFEINKKISFIACLPCFFNATRQGARPIAVKLRDKKLIIFELCGWGA